MNSNLYELYRVRNITGMNTMSGAGALIPYRDHQPFPCLISSTGAFSTFQLVRSTLSSTTQDSPKPESACILSSLLPSIPPSQSGGGVDSDSRPRGLDPPAIAQLRGVQLSTVFGYLSDCLSSGHLQDAARCAAEREGEAWGRGCEWEGDALWLGRCCSTLIQRLGHVHIPRLGRSGMFLKPLDLRITFPHHIPCSHFTFHPSPPGWPVTAN